MEFLELFFTFFKLGLFTFGGGYAMIPLLTEEVLAHGWMTQAEILNFIAVAESTPGPIAVNMATFIGATRGEVILSGFVGKFLGSFVATLGVVLPSFIIILVIVSLIQGLLQFGGVKAFLKGVRPVVIGLIISVGIQLVLSVLVGIENIYQTINFDFRALAIFGIISLVYIAFKKLKKITLSPILLIGISAILGILFYGFLG